jgi:23S rRNA pseudoU1915 N3-methylase RlmH
MPTINDPKLRALLAKETKSAHKAKAPAVHKPNVPNLDAMAQSEVSKFAAKYRNPSKAVADKLVGTRPDAVTLAKQLSAYASDKSKAMVQRVRGNIGLASSFEHYADMAYERLPSDLKW